MRDAGRTFRDHVNGFRLAPTIGIGQCTMDFRNPQLVHQLFLLNVTLQLFDGVATYYGIANPWYEANPVLAAAMTQLGIGAALLLFKAVACAALVALRCMAGQPLIGKALAGVAAVYGCLSFAPWTARNILLL